MGRLIFLAWGGALLLAGVAAGAAPTFNRDIAPILYKNCATCHRPGEVAPFSLLTYQDAVRHAQQIGTVAQSRFVPPWKAQPGYGTFQNERRLTDEQIGLRFDRNHDGKLDADERKALMDFLHARLQ